MSRDEGAPVSSGVVADDGRVNDPARQLIELVRRGQSFSGRERNCVFLNTHDNRFANVSYVSGLGLADDARAIGRVDWDADGDLDLWISNRNAPQVRFFSNEMPGSSRWISLRLQGEMSNRDAIGARVVVTAPGFAQRPLVRTLRAGDGYMSQSSKWIHVGVDQAPRCSVTVHWPAGTVTSYQNLETNQRYRCREGSSAAVRLNRSRGIELVAAPLELPDVSQTLSVFSLVRPSIPTLEFLGSDGSLATLNDFQGKPTLLVLWASWCQPCIHELEELVGHQATLDEAGVQVLALSVDGLSPDAKADPQAAATLLSRLDFPFHTGEATEPLMEKLQLVSDYLFGLKKPFPVPTSFLINKNLRLAAIYRGRLDVERLQADLKSLDVSTEQRRDRSVPFSGRWAGQVDTLPMAVLVLELIHRGFLDEASELVQRIQSVFDQRTVLDLVVRLGVAHHDAGAHDRADQHFRMARKIQPTTVGPEIELGRWYESRGQFEQARQQFARAIEKSPRSLPAINNLAWLLATCPDETLRDGEQAVRLATLAAKMTGGKHAGVLDTLAASLAEAGRFDEAVRMADRAIELSRAASRFNLAGEIERRRDKFALGEAIQ